MASTVVVRLLKELTPSDQRVISGCASEKVSRWKQHARNLLRQNVGRHGGTHLIGERDVVLRVLVDTGALVPVERSTGILISSQLSTTHTRKQAQALDTTHNVM